MKRIINKILFASILIGLLVFTACDDSLNDTYRAVPKQEGNDAANKDIRKGDSTGGIRELPEEEEDFDEDGFEWLTVYYEDGTMENILVPIEADEEDDPDEQPEFELVNITGGGMRNSQSIVVLFLGDGFRNTQHDNNLFSAKANAAAEHLLSYYPFNLFSESLAIYIGFCYSTESGVNRDVDGYHIINNNPPNIDNYFGSRFYHDGKTERMLYVTRPNRVKSAIRSAARQIGIDPSMTIVLANSTRRGGSARVGGKFAVTSIREDPYESTNFRHTVTHELGHSFGGLKDEYWWKGEETPNMTKNTPVKWSSWVGFDDIGVHKISPSGQTDWYIPSAKVGNAGMCHMGSPTREFCAVCSTELIRLMADVSGRAGYLYDILPNGEAAISGLGPGANPWGKVYIPSRIAGKTVTAIGNSAFADMSFLSDVRIPPDVKSVGENAFLNTGIWNNTANYNVVYADKWAVGYRGRSAATVTLNDIIVGIGDFAFYQKNVSNNLEIPGSVKIVGDSAFASNSSLQRIWIPSGVESIGTSAFYGCTSLTIYAQAASKPDGWDPDWYPYNDSVVWNSPEPFKKPVDWETIEGAVPPKAGFTPVTTITETEQFTGSVSWKVTSSGANHSGPFAPGTQYTATITLTAKPDYSLKNVPANFFQVAGTTIPATNAYGLGVITAVFPATASTVNIKYIYLPVPEVGELPEENIYTTQYNGTVLWLQSMASDGTFDYNTIYTAEITLTVNNGFTFQGVAAHYFFVYGATSGGNPPGGLAADQITVTATFPATSGYFAGGTGLPGDPYEISSRQHFKNIALVPNQHYKLVADINLTVGTEYWEPMDTFYGLLDGNNKEVWFYRIEETAYGSYTGIFRENHGMIKNLTVRGTLKASENYIHGGMVAGLNVGTIQNVATYKSGQGHIMIESYYTTSHVGAIVGKNAVGGVIQNSNNNGGILSPFNRSGIAAVNEGVIENSINHGSIEPDKFACGSGYSFDPYIITTAGHFNNIRYTDSSSETVFFIVANNIHLTAPGEKWEPINTFYGNIHGSYKTVSFDLIEEAVPQMHTGLFRVNYGHIAGLNVAGKINVTGGNVYSGLIVGLNSGTIWQCESKYTGSSSNYIIVNNYSSSYCGGIAGVNTGTINMVMNHGAIYSTGPKHQIVALDYGTVENALEYGSVHP